MGNRIIILTLAFLFTLLTFQEADANKKSLMIGVSACYTGALSAIGKHVSDGYLDHLRWIATHGGIEYKNPVSRKTERVAIKIKWEDNQYDVASSISSYKRLRARGADMILGFGSTPGEACAASASRNKLPYLSWYALASPAGYKPQPQYYFAGLPTAVGHSTSMTKWFVKRKWKRSRAPRIGYFVMDIPSWRVFNKPGLIDQYIKSIGGELAGIEFIPPLVTDLSVPLTRLVNDKKADCIILMGILSQTVVAAKDIARLGIDLNKTSLICNASAWDESLLKIIQKEVEGIYGEALAVIMSQDVAGMKKVKQVAKWVGRSFEELNVNYIVGFTAPYVIKEALKQALEKKGYDKLKRSDIRDALHNFGGVDTGGIMPEIKVSHPDIPFFVTKSQITQAKGGELRVVGNWDTYEVMKGALK